MIPSFALLGGITLFSSAAAAAVTHQVNVSNNTAGLIFDPSYITAAVGDIVEFTFHPKNHSVTQSSFAEPCTPLPGGFDTGFLPVANGTSSSGLPMRQLTVNDTSPIWIHCQQDANTAASHCGHGMVFAVNPGPDGSSNSFAAFLEEALEIGAELAANKTPVTHQINVSNNTAGLIFDPSYITAAVGDIVEFTFHPKNHSVTQSSFYEPCTPLPGGFDTGFLPVANGTSSSGLPMRQFTVNDTNPIWIHCQQDANTAASHCGHGMVFAVNPGPDGSRNSFAAFLAEALAVGDELAALEANNSSSWTHSTPPVTHQINVSNNTAGLIFDPSYITAAVGDIVEFTFHPKNHSVTQSSFAEPCTPLPGGFDTGFLPVANGSSSSGLPMRQFTVCDTNPIWIHCQQDANTAASHCGHGMVFAVNPGPDGSSNSFAAFLAEALEIGAELAAANETETTTTTSSTDTTTITNSETNTTTTTSWADSAAAVTHQINVSNNTAGLIFDPPYITAAVGDIVEFTFHPKNHSVTQSSFAEPCTPLPGGFDTGFLPVANGTSSSSLPTRQFTVNNTSPIWIHCQQDANTAASHCGHGMVFAVNPGPDGSSNSFAAFLAEALGIGAELAADVTTTASWWAKPTGSVHGRRSSSTPNTVARANGAISLNVGGAMLMTGLGMIAMMV